MPYWKTLYHLVWATKDRQPLITPDIEAILFPFLDRKATEFSTTIYALNGWTDHVHVVAAIPPRYSVAEVVKGFKGASAHYLNKRSDLTGNFYWQVGYGVFTLGERQLSVAVKYVEEQKAHHSRGTVNRWLELTDEPHSSGNAESLGNKALREAGQPYGIEPLEDWPF